MQSLLGTTSSMLVLEERSTTRQATSNASVPVCTIARCGGAMSQCVFRLSGDYHGVRQLRRDAEGADSTVQLLFHGIWVKRGPDVQFVSWQATPARPSHRGSLFWNCRSAR